MYLQAEITTNELAYKTSPYLQQHATNPINWLPWECDDDRSSL
jgi:uncharacterized protein YyaL (SSP411 family)